MILLSTLISLNSSEYYVLRLFAKCRLKWHALCELLLAIERCKNKLPILFGNKEEPYDQR